MVCSHILIIREALSMLLYVSIHFSFSVASLEESLCISIAPTLENTLSYSILFLLSGLSMSHLATTLLTQGQVRGARQNQAWSPWE